MKYKFVSKRFPAKDTFCYRVTEDEAGECVVHHQWGAHMHFESRDEIRRFAKFLIECADRDNACEHWLKTGGVL